MFVNNNPINIYEIKIDYSCSELLTNITAEHHYDITGGL